MKSAQLDKYLHECLPAIKESYRSNLAAILIYGSYVEGYFDATESDYDLLVFLQEEPEPDQSHAILEKYPKLSFQYYETLSALRERIMAGSWAVYMALEHQAQALFVTKEFETYLDELHELDFRPILTAKVLQNGTFLEKAAKEDQILKDMPPTFTAIKWIVPTARRRLQLLTYLTTNKCVWSLKDNLAITRKYLSDKHFRLILSLEQRLQHRDAEITSSEKDSAVELLGQLTNLIPRV
jgi:predicted nucleotidyltransferase